MPSRERVSAFVDAVLAGDFVQSIRDFYAEDATAQENLNPPRVGREALIAREQKTLDSMARVTPQLTTLLVDGDRVVIGWRFDMTSHEGVTRRLDELSLQTWRGDRIADRALLLRPGVDPAGRGLRAALPGTAIAARDAMNTPQKPARTEPGTSEEFASRRHRVAASVPRRRARIPTAETPDKEGGAPVDELDLDGDGARRQ